MAWSPSPEVAALRDFADRFGRKIVVTFSIDSDGTGFHMTTYGKTSKLCKLAGHFGDKIAEAVLAGTIAPPEVEPFEVPPPKKAWTVERDIVEEAGADGD
jgi:hypothetical protein